MTVDLLPNGRSVPVDDGNKQCYARARGGRIQGEQCAQSDDSCVFGVVAPAAAADRTPHSPPLPCAALLTTFPSPTPRIALRRGAADGAALGRGGGVRRRHLRRAAGTLLQLLWLLMLCWRVSLVTARST